MTVPTLENSSPNVSFERERGVNGLRVTRDVAHAIVEVGEESGRTVRILQVFRTLADAEVPVFLIKMHRSAVTLALAGTDLEGARIALEAADMKVTTRRDLAIVAVRAASMREMHGVISAIADALINAGAPLLEISDSHDSVQCLIEATSIPSAVACLRETFHLDNYVVQEKSVETEDPE